MTKHEIPSKGHGNHKANDKQANYGDKREEQEDYTERVVRRNEGNKPPV